MSGKTHSNDPLDYLITTRDGKTNVTFMESDGSVFDTVTNEHVNYGSIYAEITSGNIDHARLRELVKPVDMIAEKLAEVSTRFTHEDERIKFDGTVVLDEFAKQLVRILKDTDMSDPKSKRHLRAVASFGVKLMGNDSYNNRNRLLDWISRLDLTTVSYTHLTLPTKRIV